ncbi:hypothetical protein [Halovibrio sp. HP20-50]|uniref:hypothetical protein n=1 Tax=Halovibrio sp. HP20-59 TaxID=3080275 RepID=UPI00294AC451|nr:hypothetical protein [Halovibrio sp. HP20-59]MEA2120517.1 hypothetical protein [Halovibrio sp. HP20-59]
MSDFIYSSDPNAGKILAESLKNVQPAEASCVHVYSGGWGAVATSSSRYSGFNPIETSRYICIVIGGPVLYFRDNYFIGGDDQQAGTRAILSHWQSGKAEWSEDISGPFVVLVIDKEKSRVECITDLMLFIPVYQFHDEKTLFWGTHVDALSNACGQKNNIDNVSCVDFVLHFTVTYPYTFYQTVSQCNPASINRWIKQSEETNDWLLENSKTYWVPIESNKYKNIHDAAKYLHDGVQGYIDRATCSLDRVAQFISAGEDSRTLAGMLPNKLDRDAYIFLDKMNREGVLAREVAAAYGLNFNLSYRSQTHYIDILPEASDLVGTGHQYIHAHTLKFDKKHKLANYKAVFGGYIADSLLKAQHAKKPKWVKRFSFLPEFAESGESRTIKVTNPFFSNDLLDKVTARRREHYARVNKIRPNSADEWFELWPATMRAGISNLYTNRRLFASHEVFMAKESVKASASVPVNWKLNRRLFNKAFRISLSKTKYVFHADGRLPYFPWWVNCQIQAPFWLYQKVLKQLGFDHRDQGPWSNWKTLLASQRWSESVNIFTSRPIPKELRNAVESNALDKNDKTLPIQSKINLLQVCYYFYVFCNDDKEIKDCEKYSEPM